MGRAILQFATALLATAMIPGPGMQGQGSGTLDLYVSSRNDNSVKRFDGRTGEYLGDFVPSGTGGLLATQEIAFGPDGHLYVSGRGNDQILRFDGASGDFLGGFTTGYACPDGAIYICDWQENVIHRYDAKTGRHLGAFATGGGMLQPNGVVFGPTPSGDPDTASPHLVR